MGACVSRTVHSNRVRGSGCVVGVPVLDSDLTPDPNATALDALSASTRTEYVLLGYDDGMLKRVEVRVDEANDEAYLTVSVLFVEKEAYLHISRFTHERVEAFDRCVFQGGLDPRPLVTVPFFSHTTCRTDQSALTTPFLSLRAPFTSGPQMASSMNMPTWSWARSHASGIPSSLSTNQCMHESRRLAGTNRASGSCLGYSPPVAP